VTLIGYILVLPCATTAPLMPTAELALFVAGLSAMFGFFGAVPQNAAIQTITPNDMRGQVTALYLMIFVVGGALGSVVIAAVTNFVIGDESKLWLSIVITAGVLQPIAIIAMSFGLRHYHKEIEVLEAKGLY
jgi:MFS family permease